MKQSNTSSPVLLQSAADGGTNEVRVLLQLIQSLLNGLVDGLLDGLTHPIDLVYAPARLNETKRVSFFLITVQTPVHLKEGWSGSFHDKS